MKARLDLHARGEGSLSSNPAAVFGGGSTTSRSNRRFMLAALCAVPERPAPFVATGAATLGFLAASLSLPCLGVRGHSAIDAADLELRKAECRELSEDPSLAQSAFFARFAPRVLLSLSLIMPGYAGAIARFRGRCSAMLRTSARTGNILSSPG